MLRIDTFLLFESALAVNLRAFSREVDISKPHQVKWSERYQKTIPY